MYYLCFYLKLYQVEDVTYRIKKIKNLVDKLDKFPSNIKKKKVIVNFYWDKEIWQENQSKSQGLLKKKKKKKKWIWEN